MTTTAAPYDLIVIRAGMAGAAATRRRSCAAVRRSSTPPTCWQARASTRPGYGSTGLP